MKNGVNYELQYKKISDAADCFVILLWSAALHLRNAAPSQTLCFREHTRHPPSARPAAPDPAPQRFCLTTGADQGACRMVFTLRGRIECMFMVGIYLGQIPRRVAGESPSHTWKANVIDHLPFCLRSKSSRRSWLWCM